MITLHDSTRVVKSQHQSAPVSGRQQQSAPFAMVPRGWLGALRGRRLTIMCCLASFDGSQGCFVSASAISEATGLEANNVRTILRGLERDGWIARDERGERTYFVISYAGPTGQNNPCERVKTTRATGQNNPPYNVWDHTSEQTNGTYSDSAESCASQPTGRDTVPIKVVSKITKGDEEAAPPRPAAPRRPRSERDQLIDRMITWAAAKTFMREDRFVTATRKQWSALIDETAGNESLAQSIILEAYERKDKLLSTQFPVWSIFTVMFYVRYKRKPQEVKDEATIISELRFFIYEGGVSEQRAAAAKEYIHLHHVPEQTVRRAFGELYDTVFA